MGEKCLSLGIKAEEFNMVEGPGKNFRPRSSCCLCGMEKCYLRYKKECYLQTS